MARSKSKKFIIDRRNNCWRGLKRTAVGTFLRLDVTLNSRVKPPPSRRSNCSREDARLDDEIEWFEKRGRGGVPSSSLATRSCSEKGKERGRTGASWKERRLTTSFFSSLVVSPPPLVASFSPVASPNGNRVTDDSNANCKLFPTPLNPTAAGRTGRPTLLNCYVIREKSEANTRRGERRRERFRRFFLDLRARNYCLGRRRVI